MAVTLKEIETKQSKLEKMIAEFKEQTQSTIQIEQVKIELKAGEHYAGLILNESGLPSHHLILMDGSAKDVTWQSANEWAEEQGGSLPSRNEQSLLYANLKEQFEEAAYWSHEEHASGAVYAWYQYFTSGYQYYDGKGYYLRARAVRRLVI